MDEDVQRQIEGDVFSQLQPAPGRWTSIGDWRADAGMLRGRFVYPNVAHAASMLPYGIEQLAGRRLALILPGDAVPVTIHRAAFLDADIAVYRKADGNFAAVPVPSMDESVRWYGELGGLSTLNDVDAFEGPGWLVGLIDWLESRRVERIRRSQYWAWHYRGRQVLQARRIRNGYSLVAGVAYTSPREDQPAPIRLTIAADEEPDEATQARLRTHIDEAIERRRTGDDRDHREHLLQAALGISPSLLGMQELHREFPAWRPSLDSVAGRGFIDFLGVDIDGGLHVVETKIGPDHMLGVQGIDYWAWVTAHKQDIARQVGADPDGPSVQLHYVVACKQGQLMHAAAAETVRLLRAAIPWRCHVIEDWNTVDRPGQLLRPHALHGIGPRTVPDRFRCE